MNEQIILFICPESTTTTFPLNIIPLGIIHFIYLLVYLTETEHIKKQNKTFKYARFRQMTCFHLLSMARSKEKHLLRTSIGCVLTLACAVLLMCACLDKAQLNEEQNLNKVMCRRKNKNVATAGWCKERRWLEDQKGCTARCWRKVKAIQIWPAGWGNAPN